MLSSLWFLSRLSGSSLVWSLATSLMATGANLYLMAVIIAAFQPTERSSSQIFVFIALCMTLLATRSISQVLLIRVTQNTIYQLQIRIAKQVAAMEQDALETIGAIPVLSVLADDVNTISALGQQLPTLMMNLCVFVGVLLYLLHLSLVAFLMLLILLMVSTLGYRFLARHTSALLTIYRREQEEVLNAASSLISGSKELRLNDAKHRVILSEVNQHAISAQKAGSSAWQRHSIASAWSYTSYFVIIGALILCSRLGLYGVDRRSALAAVFGLLFMKGAIEGIFALIPTLGVAQVAFRRIHEVGLNLDQKSTGRAEETFEAVPITGPLKKIRLVDLEYVYAAPRKQFRLGPLSLEIQRGEIVFIAGRNGSGKTSLLKLLSGLYAAAGGYIEVDGGRIMTSQLASYRQMFSVVFQEFHVFTHIVDPSDEVLVRARHYLKAFQIDGAVHLNHSGFVFSPLSRGQHKRLALVIALMENKQFLIFDEWASDQDPHFRAYFYERLLPDLKAQGKTVIAVTHDEQWYHIADRVLWLSEGRLRSLPGQRAEFAGPSQIRVGEIQAAPFPGS